MVFDAAAPIRRKNRPAHSLEASLDEERKDVLRLLEGDPGRPEQPEIRLIGQANANPADNRNDEYRHYRFTGGTSGAPATRSRYSSHSPVSMRRRSSAGSALSSSSADGPDLYKAHRRLSNNAMAQLGGSFSGLALGDRERRLSSGSEFAHLEKDYTSEAAVESSSSTDEDDDDAADDDDDDEVLMRGTNGGTSGSKSKAEAQRHYSLEAAAEAERLQLLKKLRNDAASGKGRGAGATTSGGGGGGGGGGDAAAVRGRSNSRGSVIPNSAFSAGSPDASEDDATPRRQINPAKLAITVSERRVFETRTHVTLTRGDIAEAQARAKRLHSYLIALDLSPESIYALEWAIGTVLRDGDTLSVVSALELPDGDKRSSEELAEERERWMQQTVEKLSVILRRTRLQCVCEIEVLQHPQVKHLITEMVRKREPMSLD